MDSNSVPDSAPVERPAEPRPAKIRWWPAFVILALSAAAIIWIRFFKNLDFQHRNMETGSACLFTGLLLLLWCMFASRLSSRIRFSVLAAFLVVVAVLALSLRIRGVTGDLIPVFEWRWQKDRVAALPAESPSPTDSTAPTNRPASVAVPDGWPQFLGPNRNGIVAGPRLARDWSAHPPRDLWRRSIGTAWSGFVVANGLAVTQEQRGPDELVTCYDALTGELRWSHADPVRYATTIAGEGPRATPAIEDGRVFAFGATGVLNCLDLQTGKLIWSKDVVKDTGGSVPVWGLSVSPLILGDVVVVSAGGKPDRSLVAYNKQTGQFVWGGGKDAAGYSSPVLYTIGGTPQILIFNEHSVAGHEASSGKLLWDFPWPATHPHVANPVLLPGDRVLVSSGYGNGSTALQVQRGTNDQWTATRVWKSMRLKAKFANIILYEGYAYGLDDGILVCLDPATGEQKWKDGRDGHGQLILAGKLLLVLAENGEVVLLEPNPEARRELARFTALKSKTWNSPALAGEFLLVRNDLEAACFQLPVEK